MVAEAKAALRQTVLQRRDALPADERVSSGKRIISRVLDLPDYSRAKTILAYASIGSELDTGEFLRRVLEDGKGLVLPRVEGGELRLYRVKDLSRDLAPGTWGIPEPVPDRCPGLDISGVDFALVPGVAFDRGCRRLGHGAGFYDRLLGGGLRARAVSGAFGVQIVAEVPVDGHDVPVDAVVTEDGVLTGSPA